MAVNPWSDSEYGNEGSVDSEVESYVRRQVAGKFSKNLKLTWNLNLNGTFPKHFCYKQPQT